jgi:predicted Zn-ribbon and HTH transcriptional regulator
MPDEEKTKVKLVLRRGQQLITAPGQGCTSCGRLFADDEKVLYTPPSCPSPRYAVFTCAACYVPPGKHERFTAP